MNSKEFGAVLASLRVKAGLSKIELANRIQVSLSTVEHLEGGRRRPSVEVAIRLAKELDVSLDELLEKVPA